MIRLLRRSRIQQLLLPLLVAELIMVSLWCAEYNRNKSSTVAEMASQCWTSRIFAFSYIFVADNASIFDHFDVIGPRATE